MDDLVQFLRDRLDEDETLARAATPGPWKQSGIGEYGWGVSFNRPGSGVEAEDTDQGRADADHIALHHPGRVLAEVEAKRQILTWHRKPTESEFNDGTYRTMGCRCYGGWPCPTLRALALSYADHPDYDQAWRP